jgi:hypothetical protein
MAGVGVESTGKCQEVNPDLQLLLFVFFFSFNSLSNLLLKWPTVSSDLTCKTYTVIISEILNLTVFNTAHAGMHIHVLFPYKSLKS